MDFRKAWYEGEIEAGTLLDEVERLRTELVTAQAREQQLRNCLSSLMRDSGLVQLMRPDQIYRNDQVLTLPADDTALRAALDQRERETIERCAKAFSQWDRDGRWAASVIRALEVKP